MTFMYLTHDAKTEQHVIKLKNWQLLVHSLKNDLLQLKICHPVSLGFHELRPHIFMQIKKMMNDLIYFFAWYLLLHKSATSYCAAAFTCLAGLLINLWSAHRNIQCLIQFINFPCYLMGKTHLKPPQSKPGVAVASFSRVRASLLWSLMPLPPAVNQHDPRPRLAQFSWRAKDHEVWLYLGGVHSKRSCASWPHHYI